MTYFYRSPSHPAQRDDGALRRLPTARREPDRGPDRAETPSAAPRGLSQAEIRQIIQDILG